jgi:hypothetical protein
MDAKTKPPFALPLRVVISEDSICGKLTELKDADNRVIADSERYYPQAIEPAQASYICRAVNAYGDMLQALESIYADLLTGYIAQESVAAERNRRKLEVAARAAIQKAKG